MVHRKTEYCKQYGYPLPNSVYDAYKSLIRYRVERRRLEHQHQPLPWEYGESTCSSCSSGSSVQSNQFSGGPKPAPMKAWYRPQAEKRYEDSASSSKSSEELKAVYLDHGKVHNHGTQTTQRLSNGQVGHNHAVQMTHHLNGDMGELPVREVAVQTPPDWQTKEHVYQNSRRERGRKAVRRHQCDNGKECQRNLNYKGMSATLKFRFISIFTLGQNRDF